LSFRVFSRENHTVCCLIGIVSLSSIFGTVWLRFLGFSQKLPGGSIPTARRHISGKHCSCFGMNRLATMNFCQATRSYSRISFDLFCAQGSVKHLIVILYWCYVLIVRNCENWGLLVLWKYFSELAWLELGC